MLLHALLRLKPAVKGSEKSLHQSRACEKEPCCYIHAIYALIRKLRIFPPSYSSMPEGQGKRMNSLRAVSLFINAFVK